MSTKALWSEWDVRHVWHPYSRFSTLRDEPPLMIVRGEGPYLVDADGRRWLDAIASWWACALGHGHPRLLRALREQAAELQHSILGNLAHPRAAELAAKLAAWMPTPNRHVLFASDGASAVEAALKIALQYRWNIGQKQRHRFAYLEGAYHGDTLGAVSVGFLEAFHEPFRPVLTPAVRLPVPRSPQEEEPCLQETARLLERHAEQLTALIVEPLCQGAAGMRVYSARYLRELAELCRRFDLLLVADEIATGFGRTGRRFACEHAGVDADIVCVGKALSAGMLPISATIVKDAIYETFSDEPIDRSFYHGHTFCGNPIAAAVALEAMSVYEEVQIWDAALGLEKIFREELKDVAETRFLGAMAAVEVGSPGIAQEIRKRLRARGILVRPLGNVVYLMPPLNLDHELARELGRALADTVRGL